VHPLTNINASVHATFTSAVGSLQSDDANGNWVRMLSELNALRAAEGAASNTHYYGVVRVPYTTGTAGYGYIAGRSAVGWDLALGENASGAADFIAAHEFGHNFSQLHSPCGNAPQPDPDYPYPGGVIGKFGWNSVTNTFVEDMSTDIMGYCGNQWVSDYTWTRVMNYRATSAGVFAFAQNRAAALGITPSDGILVWGRIINGQVHLEPSFRVKAPITESTISGMQRVELLNGSGSVLAAISINAEKVDHVFTRDERHFAVVLPWSAQIESSLAAVRVSDSRAPFGATTITRATAMSSAPGLPQMAPQDPADTIQRVVGNRTRVIWNSTAFPMAIVRDGPSGQIMAFLRQPGQEFISSRSTSVEIVFSDGVRSVSRRHVIR
jgi:hypothetical protein